MALGAEGPGSMAERGDARHGALSEGQAQAHSGSSAARPGAVGMAAGSLLHAQHHGGHAERGQEWVPHGGGNGDRAGVPQDRGRGSCGSPGRCLLEASL